MTYRFLLTSGRSPVTLDLARILHDKGHKVFVVDSNAFTLCRFSKAVTKSYRIEAPKKNEERFISGLKEICEKESITHLVPTFEEILYVSKHKNSFPSSVDVFTPSFDLVRRLHHKGEFIELLKELGLPYPKTRLIHSQEELEKMAPPFILKASYSRASLLMHQVMKKEQIPKVSHPKNNPWIVQELLLGQKFCSYGIAKGGKLLAHSLYPVDFTVDGTSCINFKYVKNKLIKEWIENFVKMINFSGQIAFDFIVDSKGTIYAIECNPRATSGLHLFSSASALDKALTDIHDDLASCIEPSPSAKKQITIAMAFFCWKFKKENFWKTFFSSSDVLFSKRDPLPFLMQPLIFTNYLFQGMKQKMNLQTLFTHDLVWEGEDEDNLSNP